MVLAAAGSSPLVLWFLTRGSGLVTLVLLSLTVALGIANRTRLKASWMPRFVVDGLHRNVSLLAVCFLAVHVITTLLDNYVPIRLIDALVPFGAAYKPLWLGLGALSLDLLVAVIATSILRRRLGHRLWRATHWLAYASWPVAIVHSVGMGTDRHAHWMLALVGGCVLVVGLAVLARLADGARRTEQRQALAEGRPGSRRAHTSRASLARPSVAPERP